MNNYKWLIYDIKKPCIFLYQIQIPYFFLYITNHNLNSASLKYSFGSSWCYLFFFYFKMSPLPQGILSALIIYQRILLFRKYPSMKMPLILGYKRRYSLLISVLVRAELAGIVKVSWEKPRKISGIPFCQYLFYRVAHSTWKC